MITIYLHIVKNFLIHNIKRYTQSSVSKDVNLFNKAASFLGAGRDTALSSFKQELAEKLIQDINNFETHTNDKQNLEGLKDLIRLTKKAAKDEASKRGYTDGSTFDKNMDETCNMAENIYYKLGEQDETSLLDVIYLENDPFTIYRYYLSVYLSQKVYDAQHPNTFKYYTEHPKISNMAQLTINREQLVWVSIRDCIKKLNRLDKNIPDYEAAKQETVLEVIKALNTENKILCKKLGIDLAIPIISIGVANVSVGMPTLRPECGCLEVCMSEAEVVIKKLKFLAKIVDIKVLETRVFETKLEKQTSIKNFFNNIPSNESSLLPNQLDKIDAIVL